MPFDATDFTTVAEPQVVTDLRAARALLDHPSKWTQGCLSRNDGSRCVMGAFRVVVGFSKPRAGKEDAFTDAWNKGGGARYEQGAARINALRDVYREAISRRYRSDLYWRAPVEDFNDETCRKHADIMAVFDAAIASEMEQAYAL